MAAARPLRQHSIKPLRNATRARRVATDSGERTRPACWSRRPRRDGLPETSKTAKASPTGERVLKFAPARTPEPARETRALPRSTPAAPSPSARRRRSSGPRWAGKAHSSTSPSLITHHRSPITNHAYHHLTTDDALACHGARGLRSTPSRFLTALLFQGKEGSQSIAPTHVFSNCP